KSTASCCAPARNRCASCTGRCVPPAAACTWSAAPMWPRSWTPGAPSSRARAWGPRSEPGRRPGRSTPFPFRRDCCHSGRTGPSPAKAAAMIALLVPPRRRDLGAFEVGRVLPFAKRRMVGPYIFFDRIGPKDLAPGLPREADVRPHPHIGLSTVTYLFAGEITHRDSLGSHQVIRPGAVNWMTAGRGITHSERSEALRARGGALDGIQAWVALPEEHEDGNPGFWHVPAADLPVLEEG